MANELTYQSVFTGQEMDERFTAVAQLQAALLEVETALSAKYVKPASGIPETDLDSAVQSALAKARSAVQDLSNYYTKTEIDSLLAAVNSQEYVDVATLPTASASTLGKIYLVGPTDNQYDRYYTSYDGSDYSWVAAGSTEINLSNYATKAELNQLDQEVNGLPDTVTGTGSAWYREASKLTAGTTLSLRLVSNTGSKINIFANGQTNIGSLETAGDTSDIVLASSYDSLYFYQGTAGNFEIKIGKNGLSKQVENLGDELVVVKSDISDLEKEINGIVINGSGDARFEDAGNLTQGTVLSLKLLSNAGSAINVFAYTGPGVYDAWGVLSGEMIKELTKNYSFIYFYQSTSGAFSINVGANTVMGQIEKNRADIQEMSVPAIRALILGDSYSQSGGQWVSPMLENLPNGSSFVSLAVSNATIRDRYADRDTYPYSSRPVENGSGNNNVLASQVEKLKRLMAGVDLDAGESQLYTTSDEYPNVIILQGGLNDHPDTEEVEATYYSQFEEQVNNVYQKMYESDTATIGSCFVQTPLADVDRTCFAGAYRYLIESLLDIFPDAQIFVATATMIGYWNQSVVARRYKTTEQQRKSAKLCGASIIDWGADSELNTITNYPSGTGTQDDPYVWGKATSDPARDTTDCLHPNTRGGAKLGVLSASVIKQRFLSIISNT